MIRTSIFTSSQPAILSKTMKLGSDGNVVKAGGGNMSVGFVQTATFPDFVAFADMLQQLTPKNAIGHGICAHEKARVTWSGGEELLKPCELPTITRTRSCFSFPTGPAVMMLDYDPRKGHPALSVPDLLSALYSVWPGMEDAPHVALHSAGSFIFNGEEQLIGQRGVRVYVMVADGTDIERAGKALFFRLICAGYGWAEVTKAGSVHPKTIVDRSVWQPERLDFIGGAACEAPLEQRRPAPTVYNAGAEPIGTATTLKDLTMPELKKLEKIQRALRAEVADEAAAVKERWSIARAESVVLKEGGRPEDAPERVVALAEQFKRAVDHRILFADFVLHKPDGKTVTVGELLDDRNRWHNTRFADPLEPDYGHDPRIAYANLRAAGRSYIWSHAHGGIKYTLCRAKKEIRLEAGNREEIVGKSLEILKASGELFYRGSEIVRVSDSGEIVPLDNPGLQYELDRCVRYTKYSAKAEKWNPCDAPRPVAEGVRAQQAIGNGLPVLEAVLTAPTYCIKTGRILDEEGYDARALLVLALRDMGTWKPVPDSPTFSDVRDAINTLWTPFAAFPVVTPVDRSVLLAMILTAIIRPVLPTAPGFSTTAPTAGSGKTLIARSIAALVGVSSPAVMPGVKDDDELRKRLLGLGRQGSPVMILDNLVGIFSSDCLCAWLTSAVYSDRVLGVTGNISVPTRSMLILTGNNLTLKGDICRRVLPCRIDPQMETPWKRSFQINPVEFCRVHRLELVRAALIIIKYYIENPPKLVGGTASFEEWNDTIRRAVVGVGVDGFLEVTDPNEAIDASYSDDPETAKLGALLETWYAVNGENETTVAEIIAKAEARGLTGILLHPDLNAAVVEVGEDRGRIVSRRLGRWIEKNSGRIIKDFSFIKCGMRHGVWKWKVKKGGFGG